MNNSSFSEAAESAASAAAFTTSNPLTPGVQETPAADNATELPVLQNHALPTPVSATRLPLAQLPSCIGLLPRQRVALQALASGQTVRAAAQLAGVTVMTLYRWRKYHPRFVAAWNTWESESEKTSRDCLVVARESAARTVMNATQTGDVRVSMAVLRGLGALTQPKPGPRFAAQVQKQLVNESDEIKLHTSGETREVRQRRAVRKAETKKALEIAARRQKCLGELKLPPLPRPITQEAIDRYAKEWAGRVRLRSDSCSVRITAVTGDIARLAKACEAFAVQVERRLETLPLIFDSPIISYQSERLALELESYGATVELRPGWVD